MDELSMPRLITLVYAKLAMQFEMALGRGDYDSERCCHHGDWGASSQTAIVRYAGGEEVSETQPCDHVNCEFMYLEGKKPRFVRVSRCLKCGKYIRTSANSAPVRAQRTSVELPNAWGGRVDHGGDRVDGD